nr:hypothetical protein [uncultured Acinetobacter sp.]
MIKQLIPTEPQQCPVQMPVSYFGASYPDSQCIEGYLWDEDSGVDDWEEMMDDNDITKWDPIAPAGFFLMDIGFGEDDAYAIFARTKRDGEVAA